MDAPRQQISGMNAFPANFMWGASTSAHQVEGGNRLNDWWRFEQITGAIHDGNPSGDACRHYELFDSDFALAAGDGHNAHRLSVEWSRIEPEPGRHDAKEIAHYHEVFASMKRHGLTPVVTLHHFTNPLWIADRGGWESPATIDAFVEFARFCAREYGSEVDWWCTVNEPEVYAFRSYSEGRWPPKKKDDSAALAVIANLLEAHGRAYRVIHETDQVDADGDGKPAMVGFAKHLVQLEPARPWLPIDSLRAYFEDQVFNEAVLRAPLTGAVRLAIPGARSVNRVVDALRDSVDYVGLNYYTRWMVKATGPEAHVARPGARLNDLGWEIYPEGLGLAVRRLAKLGKPIVVLEHGIADADDDARPSFIEASLRSLASAIGAGAQVRGYFHWSLMDNFEWDDGFAGRFGLYGVDFSRPERPRRRTRSAAVYAEMLRIGAGSPNRS